MLNSIWQLLQYATITSTAATIAAAAVVQQVVAVVVVIVVAITAVTAAIDRCFSSPLLFFPFLYVSQPR